MRFTDDGSALVPFGVGCTSDGSFIANCPDAITGHLTQAGGPTGSEVEQTNGFFAVTFAATESVDLFADVLLGSVESNSTSYVSGATLSSIWTPTVYRDNPYLPASVRSIMVTENRNSFRLSKGGSYPGVLDIDTNGRSHNDFDTEMFRLGVDWAINDNWQMRVSTRVLRPYLNLDQAYVQGIDFEVTYARDVDWLAAPNESFSVRLLGGELENRTNTVAGSVPDEFAGALFGAAAYPELTANATASYRFGRWSVQLQQRYIDAVKLDRRWVEGIDIDDDTIESESWANLVLGFQNEMSSGARWRLSFNVQNLFDDDPPIIPATGGGRFGAQAMSNTYDICRRYQLGFSMDL